MDPAGGVLAVPATEGASVTRPTDAVAGIEGAHVTGAANLPLVVHRPEGPTSGKAAPFAAPANRSQPRSATGLSRWTVSEQRFGGVDAGPERAYLSPDGPHRCDVCGDVVATLEALRRDCSEHGLERGRVVVGCLTVEDPADLNVIVADVREAATVNARQSGRDPLDLQIEAVRALLRAARTDSDSDRTRAAIGHALDWTTTAKLTGDPDA